MHLTSDPHNEMVTQEGLRSTPVQVYRVEVADEDAIADVGVEVHVELRELGRTAVPHEMKLLG